MSKYLQKLRAKINQIDKELLKTLAERFEITQKVGEYKAKYNLPVVDKKREQAILESKKLLAKKLKIDQNLTSQIFKTILKFVRVNHKKIKTEI
jgi:chorismate mutase